MTNATADPRRANQQPPAAPQPADPGPQAPLNYRAEFLIETEEGFHVLIVGEQLSPRDVHVWVKGTSAALLKQGFKPVRRDLQVTIEPAAPTPGKAATGGGGAEWLKGENGQPPRCSLHGAAKWMEGTSGPQAKNPGTAYAFWACQTRNCRPKGEPT